MFHPTIKSIVIILFIIVISIYVIFFSRPEEQTQPIFAEKIQYELDVFEEAENAIFKEFSLGEYFTKIGEFEKAHHHFHNVYHNYPNFPKGYIKWRALQNMKQIEKIQEIIDEGEFELYDDTDALIEEHFRNLRK
jgi:hypothetical protein